MAGRPNILFILSDDQGPWALGSSGNAAGARTCTWCRKKTVEYPQGRRERHRAPVNAGSPSAISIAVAGPRWCSGAYNLT